MDEVGVTLLREVLAGTGWLESTRSFAGALRTAVSRPAAVPGGLLLVGTEQQEPWHLAAHLTDEAQWCGLPELAPTLVRHTVPPGSPAHLAVPLRRLEQARRGETVFVVAPERAREGLLERVDDARRIGATVLALESGDPELRALAHEALTAEEDAVVGFDAVQHLVSAAAGESVGRSARASVRSRLARVVERLTAPPPPLRW